MWAENLKALAILVSCAIAMLPAPTVADDPSDDAQAADEATTVAEAATAATAGEIRGISLAEAVAHARRHHPRSRGAQERVRSRLLDIGAVTAQWQPKVGLMGQLIASTTNNSSTTLLSSPVVDLPRIGATSIDERPSAMIAPSTAVAVGVRQQLFDFGRIGAEAAAQRLLLELERHNAKGAELDVVAAVAQAYYAVHAARAVLDASRAAAQRAKVHGDLARAWVDKGLRPAIELARTEADLARFEIGVLRAEVGVRVARAVFAAACAVPDQELDVAGAEPSFPPLPPLATLLRRSHTRNPAVLAAKTRVAAQQASADALDAQLKPNLFVTSTLSGRAGGARNTNGPVPFGEGYLPVVPNWHAGVVLAWPVFDAVIARQQEATRSLAHALTAESQDLERALQAQVTVAYYEARQAQLAITAVERAASAAAANYGYAEQRFRVGLGSSVELSDAEGLRVETEIQLASARSQAAQSRAALARAIAEEP